MDEAMHPLALLTFGLYGEVLPNQNGAPVRMVVPWKYGFKSAKSIVKIRFVDKQPPTSWNIAAANEYGFYSNVNLTWTILAGARPRNGVSAKTRGRRLLGPVRAEAQDLDVQRLRCAGGVALSGDGPEEEFLMAERDLQASAAQASPRHGGVALLAPSRVRAVKVCAWLLALLPFARLMYLGATSQFGANPLEFVTRSTGTWTLVMLCVTLAVTPLRRITGWHWLIRLRRMFGLFTFFYGVQHFMLWLAVDRGFDVAYMIKDIGKRPFITVGLRHSC
jgi:hypothetical protein